MGDRCGVIYRSLAGPLVCGSPRVFRHVRFGDGPDDIGLVCHVCWGRVLAQGGFVGARVYADHPVDLPCLLPEGEWDDDGCVLPIPDTAAELDHVDVDQAVPA